MRDTLKEQGEQVATGAITYMQARTANQVLKAQEQRPKLQQIKGELVDRAKAGPHVVRLARDQRGAWINWPARAAAVIAAGLQVDTHQLHIALEH